jgi:hypothetical protein
MFLKEDLLNPDVHVDASDCDRNKRGSTEEHKNAARRPRALEEAEQEEKEEEEDEEAGEMRQFWDP